MGKGQKKLRQERREEELKKHSPTKFFATLKLETSDGEKIVDMKHLDLKEVLKITTIKLKYEHDTDPVELIKEAVKEDDDLI